MLLCPAHSQTSPTTTSSAETDDVAVEATRERGVDDAGNAGRLTRQFPDLSAVAVADAPP